MTKALKLRTSSNRSKINVREDFAARHWMKHLGVTKEQLAAAIDKVGNSAAAVRKELRPNS